MRQVVDDALWRALAMAWQVEPAAATALAQRTAAAGLLGAAGRPEYLALASAALQWIERQRRSGQPYVFGVVGAQGTGKSTLALHLAAAAETAGLRLAVIGIDDFYLPQAVRMALAERVHPLLRTRGVPGTHDIALAERCLAALCATTRSVVRLPVFDKGLDDRLAEAAGRDVGTPLDIVVFEGWCVGLNAEDQPSLAADCNDLEAREDADGRWRHYVNARLASDYAALFARLDGLLGLVPPDMAAVLRWRTEQEQALPAARRMPVARLQRFIAHYERLTRHGIDTLPGRADLLVRLDHAHRVAELQRCGAPALPVR